MLWLRPNNWSVSFESESRERDHSTGELCFPEERRGRVQKGVASAKRKPFGTKVLSRLCLPEIRAAVQGQSLQAMEKPRVEMLLDKHGQVLA